MQGHLTRFCQVIDYYIHILEREGRRLKFPKILFLGAKHARKSIISIRTINYTSKQKSLKIEGFKSFFFPLNKTYDFWTIFQSGQRREQERRKGQERQDGTERKERKGREKKEGKGYIPRRGGGGKLIISTLTKKRKISTPYIVYNIIYRLI